MRPRTEDDLTPAELAAATIDMDRVLDREGRVAGVDWSDVRQRLNNLREVYEEECSDLGELYAIARASANGSLAAEVEEHRTMEELDERISRDDLRPR